VTRGNDPIVGSNFFVASGSTYAWDDNQYKADVFAVSLPLPAPFSASLVLLCGTACGLAFVKKYRRAV
jgi:hypothetical protein